MIFLNSCILLTLAKLNNLNVHPLEVVSHYRNPELQVAENYYYLYNMTNK